MGFAQALARIEELLNLLETTNYGLRYQSYEKELDRLTTQHADSIVQLGKVSAEMRADFDACNIQDGPNGGMRAYDKLMKGEP